MTSVELPTDDATEEIDGDSLYDALGVRDNAGRLIGVLIRLDAQYQEIGRQQGDLLVRLDLIDGRIGEWALAVKAMSLAGQALAKGAQSRLLWLLLGVALGIGALSIDAVGRAVAPLILPAEIQHVP